MLAQTVTLILLAIFLYCGYQAGWFDVILFGTVRPPELVAHLRANVSGAALLAWSMRNEFGRGG